MQSIRIANLSDAKALSSFAEATFRDTFAEENSVENMRVFCEANYSEAIQATEIANSRMATLLCEENNQIIGYVQLQWSTTPACVKAKKPGEIQRLYVAKEWHGKNIAHRLIEASLNEMADRHSDVVWLGVWEKNPRAIAFYQKLGFTTVGDHIFQLGSDRQRDIIMVRPIA